KGSSDSCGLVLRSGSARDPAEGDDMTIVRADDGFEGAAGGLRRLAEETPGGAAGERSGGGVAADEDEVAGPARQSVPQRLADRFFRRPGSDFAGLGSRAGRVDGEQRPILGRERVGGERR